MGIWRQLFFQSSQFANHGKFTRLVVRGARIRRPLQVFDSQDAARIDAASMAILERTGIRFDNISALDVFRDAGANVDFERRIVRIPEELLRSSLKHAPPQYVQCARNSENDVVVGGDEVHMRGGSGQTQVIDPVLGERRPATLNDLQTGTRLMDGLRNIHLLGAPGTGCWVTPQEVPPTVADIYAWRTLFEFSEKAVSAWIYNAKNAHYVIRMGTAIARSREELRKRPLVGFECEATSPLQYSSTALGTMFVMAEEGLPVLFAPIPMAGATSPVTLAGTLALGNAEVLAGIALAQLITPGMPCVYGGYGSSFDMRACSNTYAGPEMVLIQAGMVQLARLHGLPSATNSATTDSKAFDAQAGFETGLNFALTALAGANLSGTVGQLGVDQGACIEQVVMADEMAAITYRIVEGVRVDEEALAIDVIDRVGPGGSFLGQKHTVINFSKEHLLETIMDRSDWEYWKKHNGKDVLFRAREKAETILSEHWPSQLATETKNELDRLLAEATANSERPISKRS